MKSQVFFLLFLFFVKKNIFFLFLQGFLVFFASAERFLCGADAFAGSEAAVRVGDDSLWIFVHFQI